MAKEADIADAGFICKELQRRGLLKSYILEESVQAINFVTYLTDFWDWGKSPYIKEKLRRNHGIHRRYAIEMTGTISRYWAPFFKGKVLGEITRQDIEAFIAHLESLPEKADKEQSEIDRALQEEERECLYIRHSWNFQDGLKTTKNNESRTVEVPFPGLMSELIEMAKNNPRGGSVDKLRAVIAVSMPEGMGGRYGCKIFYEAMRCIAFPG
jgi:hypothetical protein